MDEREKQRSAHLVMLVCYTILTSALICETLLMGWETWAIIILLASIIVNWTMHIGNRFSENARLYFYSVQMLLVAFFYGIHESSMFDLAPLMIIVMLLISFTQKMSILNICMAAYYFTMFYDVFFATEDLSQITPLYVSRLIFHMVLVYMAGRLLKVMLRRQIREKETMEVMIARLGDNNQKMEDFLTNVSHELRTPINVVTGITAVMLKNEEDEKKKRDISAIQMAGHRLFSQIEDILDYTEIDSARITVCEDVYMISSIVNDVISEIQMMEREDMPELIFDLDASMPAAFLGDGDKIKKIIRHLLNNAIKFTKKGGVYVRICTLRKDYGVNLSITISDTGEGIAAQKLEKIKDSFYQIQGSRNRTAGGLGLGLPIVSGMVECMEGFLQSRSEEEKGTVMSVSIPQKIADQRPMVTLEKRERLCPACFLKPEKYELPAVRDYYNETINHMVESMGISIHRVFHIDELEMLVRTYQITHLFIGEQEYEENPSLFEELACRMAVIVVADQRFSPLPGTRIKFIRKPFYCLSVANMLNAETVQDEYSYSGKSMICPGVKILVVDDEPMNLMVAEGIFREYQMTIRTAHSGMEALEICEKEDFDLIFLDHMMPQMDGVETLKRLRRLFAESGRNVSVVAFTANAVSGAREMFVREGFDEFVSKPIEMAGLERVLKKLLPKSAIRFTDKDGSTERKVKWESMEQPIVQEAPDEELSGGEKASLLKAAGIHSDNGMQYCLDNEAFYEELLIKFAQDADKKLEDMDRAFGQEDWENYRIMVHALKSTSRMIGADDLSGQAKGLEDAAKNLNVEYIRAQHENLAAGYRETVQAIRNIYGEKFTGEEQAQRTEISGAELCRRLNEIESSLGTFEVEKAKNLMGQLGGFTYRTESVAALLTEAEHDLDDFETAAAAEKIKALMNRVEGEQA